MNNKSIKLVSKIMLFAILLMGALSLSACNIIQRGKFSAGGCFDTFKEAEEYINDSPKDGYTFILFDLDDEESVEKTSYNIGALGKRQNNKLVFYWGILRGTFYVIKDTEDSKYSKYRIDYQFRMKGIDVADDAEFEIKLLLPHTKDTLADRMYMQDIYKNLSIGDQNNPEWLYYGLYADGKIITEIIVSIPLVEDENFEEYYQEYYHEICNILLENIVVIK